MRSYRSDLLSDGRGSHILKNRYWEYPSIPGAFGHLLRSRDSRHNTTIYS